MKTTGILINIVKYHGYITFECLECFQQTIIDRGQRSFPFNEDNFSADDELECQHCRTMHHVSGLIENKLIIKKSHDN
jgi:hypothetical protein